MHSPKLYWLTFPVFVGDVLHCAATLSEILLAEIAFVNGHGRDCVCPDVMGSEMSLRYFAAIPTTP